ncbi:putative DNA mismatch repair protein MutS/MSH [Helianthus annuus]|nr:putative DNA mismatch repair protein MutS/MSH [Helianthus annuus]KAJ0709964.1 putative DNA mismatch repair protein MutS/MSH [Helianthus annuus]KAJ0886134.1 putative DNA mismatch repair protein MutS/MSH [Helianthus annuus]
MKRQQSILSFLQKRPPVPENEQPVTGGAPISYTAAVSNEKLKPRTLFASNRSSTHSFAVETSDEIRGTDTPPEKEQRPFFPLKSVAAGEDDGANRSGQSMFSSIKHKFMKPNSAEKLRDRNLSDGSNDSVNLTSNKYSYSNGRDKESSFPVFPKMENVIDVEETVCKGNKGYPFVIESEGDITGPETPGTQPLVSRLKRVQEDSCNLGSSATATANFSTRNLKRETPGTQPLVPRVKRVQEDSCNLGSTATDTTNFFMGNSKRVKFSHDILAENKKDDVVSEMASKFEWLHPSKIKDANGRRPDNPLYDKRTLYIPPDVFKKMSASQKQYWSVKSQYMDVLIFFKVGKFYELYELDAEIGHKELDWKITMSGVGKCRQVGITEHAIDDAIEKLLARMYKVGRVEQLETADQAKSRGNSSVIQRKLVQVLTPSTLIHGNIGPQAVHLLSLKEGTSDSADGTTAFGFAFVDCASLQFWIGSVTDDASCAALGALLMQVSPAEVIYESQGLSKETQKALNKYSMMGSAVSQLTPAQPFTDFVDSSEVRNVFQLNGYFKGSSNVWDRALDEVVHQDIALYALGGLTNHLSRLKLDDALRNGSIHPYEVYRGCLRMDGQTMANLEIFSNNADGGTSGTLYKYLDNCVTLSGKGLLRRWICHPLKDVEDINRRLNVVEELMGHVEITALIAQYLKKLPHLERFLGQIKATLKSSALLLLPLIGNKILKQRVKAFGSLVKGLRVGLDLLMLLQKEDSVFSLFSKIFSLPMLSGTDGLDKFLTQFEAAIDSDFPNYQAHELKDSDAEILSILIELFMEKANEWSQVIFALSCIDVLRSFAITANFSCMPMSRPVIVSRSNSSGFSQRSMGPTLHMRGLWHPYALGESGGTPVPNDLCLGDNEFGYSPRTLLLTGPNMGGKSTLLRATCLAVILAQLGCYVPCETCVLSPVDIIFTRLGATDRIMTGESTFLIECTETASVLQNASQDSLVILDELGRGTSTFDGYAIAYAVFRHLVDKVNCRLLFATHYHPLTKEFATHPHVTLQHMACTFKPVSDNSSSTDQRLIFLYRLAAGACPKSYGMQVALMAGIPKKVVEAATKAAEVMKTKIGVSFRSSERRSEFSTLHEDWLKTILTVSKADEDGDEDDVFDTLFCLWHELKCSNQKL